MIPLAIAATIGSSTVISFDFSPLPIREETARKCASIVGVPYGTDNITDWEWERFKRCVLQTN